jgi:hypothetical protein
MKVETVNIPGKGICLLISDFERDDIARLAGGSEFSTKLPSYDLIFTDINEVVKHIRIGHKIAAIKEIRTQTGWGLKEAKDYIDKFWIGYDTYNTNDPMECRRAWNLSAERFIREHTPQEDFIEENDLKL